MSLTTGRTMWAVLGSDDDGTEQKRLFYKEVICQIFVFWLIFNISCSFSFTIVLVIFQDDELKMIIEKARKMEEEFGHYFDLIIVNQDVDRSYDELLAELNRLELEPQWVPVQWMT